MPNIKITVAGKIATNTTPDVVIVCGNSDYTVTFDLDAEWAAETTRTARFSYIRDGRTRYKEKTFQGNTVAVPKLSGIRQVTIGLYAGTPDDPGDLRTTTAAAIWCKPSILCGDAAEEITQEEKAGLQSQVDGLGLRVENLEKNGSNTGGNGSDTGRNPTRRGVYYVVTDYGVSTEAEDNTPALQALVDMISAQGGGVIWFPVGTYNFRRCGQQHDKDGFVIDYAVRMESNVSIVGESIAATVLRQSEGVPYALFMRMATADKPLVGCTFDSFTVDAYATGDVGNVYGKAFYAQYLRNCVFRELVLAGTPATALGVDYLDCVYFDHVTCVDAGRTWTGDEAGTSGIGLGVGGWENENFTVSNCIGIRCGQHAVFIESQPQMGWGGNRPRPKGMIVTGCIARDGLNKGFGVRGVENVTFIGCESYNNAADGYYIDLDCRHVHIRGCSGTGNGGQGILLNTDAEAEHIEVHGCSFVGNAGAGIRVETPSSKLTIMNNYTDDNLVGLSTSAVTLPDCAIRGNVFMDDVDSQAFFTGNTQYNEIWSNTAPTKIVLSSADLTEDVKIMPDGSESTEADARSTGYLDVSAMGGTIKIVTTYGNMLSGCRVAQYGGDKVSLVTNAPFLSPMPSPYELVVEKLAGAAYIRLFYAPTDVGVPAYIESIVVETA